MKLGRAIGAVALSLILVVVPLRGAGIAKIIDGVFININGNAVTFSEFREFVAHKIGISEGDAEEYLRNETSKDNLQRLSDAFIDVKLIRFELQKTGGEVKDEEVEEVIQRIVKDNKMTQEGFARALEGEGITIQMYRENLREEMEKSRIIRSMKGNEVLVTDEEAKKFYITHRDRFRTHYEIMLQTLTIPFSLDKERSDLVRFREIVSTADELVARGGTLVDVERLFGDNGLKPEVVETGFVSIDDLSRGLVPDIEKLGTGETSQSIIYESKVFYVKVMERSGGDIVPFEEVVGNIKEELVGKRSISAIKEIIEELRSSSYVEVYL